MKYKVNYFSGDDIVEVTIKDQTGKRVDKFAANQMDHKAIKRIGDILRNKYGIDFSPPEKTGFFDS